MKFSGLFWHCANPELMLDLPCNGRKRKPLLRNSCARCWLSNTAESTCSFFLTAALPNVCCPCRRERFTRPSRADSRAALPSVCTGRHAVLAGALSKQALCSEHPGRGSEDIPTHPPAQRQCSKYRKIWLNSQLKRWMLKLSLPPTRQVGDTAGPGGRQNAPLMTDLSLAV